jgi:hypothetical protein
LQDKNNLNCNSGCPFIARQTVPSKQNSGCPFIARQRFNKEIDIKGFLDYFLHSDSGG